MQASTPPGLSQALTALNAARVHREMHHSLVQKVWSDYPEVVAAIRQHPDDVHPVCDAALILSHVGHVRPARLFFEKACRRWSHHPRPWAERAALADRCGMHLHALNLYDQAIQRQDIPLLHGLRAWLLTRLGREAEAEQAWRNYVPGPEPWLGADLPLRDVSVDYPEMRSLLAHRVGALLIGWTYDDFTSTDTTGGVPLNSGDIGVMLTRCLLLCRSFAWPLRCIVSAHPEAEHAACFLAHHLQLPVVSASAEPALLVALTRDRLPTPHPGQITFAVSAAPFDWTELPDICGVLQPRDSSFSIQGPYALQTQPQERFFLDQVERWYHNPQVRPQLRPAPNVQLQIPEVNLCEQLLKLQKGDPGVVHWFLTQELFTEDVAQRSIAALERVTESEHRLWFLVLALRCPNADLAAWWNREPELRCRLFDTYEPEARAALVKLGLFDPDLEVVEAALGSLRHLELELTPQLLDRLQQLWRTDETGGAVACLLTHLGVQPFISALEGECLPENLRCIVQAAELRHIDHVRPLLHHENSDVRHAAASRLADWHDLHSLDEIIELVQHDGPGDDLLFHLVRLGGPTTESIAVNYLATHPKTALKALHHLRSSAGLECARQLAPSHVAADYLGAFGSPDDDAILERHLLDPHARYPAARALWSRDWHLARYVLEAGL